MTTIYNDERKFKKINEKRKENFNLPDGELNPGLPRDRRGYSPLYYRGFVYFANT